MTPTITIEPIDLKRAWTALREENPGLRIREAAEKLGVSEAELLATGVGSTVTRLDANCAEILQQLDALGRVMALTRNDAIVHERKGEYKNVEIMTGHGKMGLAVNDDIDLRIFFDKWHHAFAVTGKSPRGATYSFQFFGADGTAIHKVFLTETSDFPAYEKLIEKYRSADQNPIVSVKPIAEKTAEKPDAEIDVEAFRAAWANLKDTHDFFPLLQKFGVAREQALRLADKKMARKVDADGFKFVLEEASKRKLPIMIFVGNAGIIQIHTGEVERIAEARGWFNVLDERFNLHIKQDKIASAWIVKKPTADGIVTSLELFNENGENVALFFGKRKPGIPESEEWRGLLRDLIESYAESSVTVK
jgi:putative hemin transport protein